MRSATLSGTPPIEVRLRRTARARRISLRVSGLDGRVTLSMPPCVAEAEALAFARSREAWIRACLSSQPSAARPQLGGTIPFEGRPLRIVSTSGRSELRAENDEIAVGGTGPVGARLRGLLRAAARDRLAEASDRYAAELGRGYRRIVLRDPRSRWGSCSSAGDLMYSWRLVMAPPEILDYVAAHEVAHLVEMNHSPAFWRIVATLCPDHARHRGWLRREGPALHRVTFDD